LERWNHQLVFTISEFSSTLAVLANIDARTTIKLLWDISYYFMFYRCYFTSFSLILVVSYRRLHQVSLSSINNVELKFTWPQFSFSVLIDVWMFYYLFQVLRVVKCDSSGSDGWTIWAPPPYLLPSGFFFCQHDGLY